MYRPLVIVAFISGCRDIVLSRRIIVIERRQKCHWLILIAVVKRCLRQRRRFKSLRRRFKVLISKEYIRILIMRTNNAGNICEIINGEIFKIIIVMMYEFPLVLPLLFCTMLICSVLNAIIAEAADDWFTASPAAAVELSKFVAADVPIAWVVPLYFCRCSRTEIEYLPLHSLKPYLFKQAYNVINKLFITGTNILHTNCRQLFRWDPAPSTSPTSTKAEDMGLPTSWCLSKKTYRCCIYLVSTI